MRTVINATEKRSVWIRLDDIYASNLGGSVSVRATAWVYWGDGGYTCDSFTVRHIFDINEDGLVCSPDEPQDHDDINGCLRDGLGRLGLVYKDEIISMMLSAAQEEISED